MNVNFWVHLDTITEYHNFISLCEKMGYELKDDTNRLKSSRYLDDRIYGIGIFGGFDNYLTSTEFVDIIPHVSIFYDTDDIKHINGKKVGKDKLNERVINFKKDMDEETFKQLDKLKKLIKKYPKLKIGTSVISNIDIEYKFYKESYFKYPVIIGYEFINIKGGEWSIRTNSGYPDFKGLTTKEDFMKSIKND